MSLPKNSKTASACSSAVGGASAHVHWGCLLASALAFGCSGGVRGEGDVDEPSTATSEQSGDSATSSGSATPTGSSTSTGEPFTTGGTTSSNGGVPAPTTTVVENPSVAPTSFACDATAVPSTAPLRRLSAVQYQNSVRDVILRSLGAAVDDGSLDRALEASWGELAADERLKVPEDLHGSYRRVDQRVQQPHVDGWYTNKIQIKQ